MHETYDRDIIQLVGRSSAAMASRLGIVGGGQLAKMTALAGLQLDCDVVVLERNHHSPAANLASGSRMKSQRHAAETIKFTQA